MPRRTAACTAGSAASGDLQQGHHDHGRVVDVGIKLVAILEVPAARLDSGAAGLPVARPAYLLVEQPARRLGRSRGRPRDRSRPTGRSSRSPYPRRARGKAALWPDRRPRCADRQAAARPTRTDGRIRVVAQALERHDRVNHRAGRSRPARPSPRSARASSWCAALIPGRRHDAGTQRSAHLRTRSTPRKNDRPGKNRASRPPRRQIRSSFEEQLADPSLRIDRPHRLVVRHDRQRHDDRARPGRHRAQAEIQPRGNQHHLRRNARAFVVADLTEQRQVKPGEAVAGVGSSRLENRLPRTDQGRIVGRVTHELEREVRLDRRADFRRPAGIDRPAALGKLAIQNVPGIAVADRLALTPQERQQQDRFRLENRVALELADPVPVGLLPVNQPGSSPLLRGFEIVRFEWRSTASVQPGEERNDPRTRGLRLPPCWRSCVLALSVSSRSFYLAGRRPNRGRWHHAP